MKEEDNEDSDEKSSETTAPEEVKEEDDEDSDEKSSETTASEEVKEEDNDEQCILRLASWYYSYTVMNRPSRVEESTAWRSLLGCSELTLESAITVLH